MSASLKERIKWQREALKLWMCYAQAVATGDRELFNATAAAVEALHERRTW